MVPLLLLLLLLLRGGSLQELAGYELRMQRTVTVQKGLCIHVPCSFSYPGSSSPSQHTFYTYWFEEGANIKNAAPVATNNPKKPVKKEFQNRFLLADPRTNNCSLSIRDARTSDSGAYFFRVETHVQYSYHKSMLSVQVTALTEKPNIYIPEPLEPGRPAQLTCSLPGACEGGSHLNFSWVGDALDSLNTQTLHSSVLTFTPRPQDHGSKVTCLMVAVVETLVTTRKTVQLNVSYSPRNLTIGISFRNVTALKILQNTSSLPILEGEAVWLLCEADSNPPAELSWFRGSPALNSTPISSTETLELPHVGTLEEGEFSCRARHPLGSQTLSLSLSVVYPPQLLGPSCSWEDQGLHCSCSSRAQPAPSLRWRLGTGLLEGNHSNASYMVTSWSDGPWVNSSLSLSQELSAGLRLSCEASNVHGALNAAVLLVSGKSVCLAGVVPAGVVPAALGGAGVMALLSLCLCLLFLYIVRARRKPAAGRPKVKDSEDPVMGTATWGSKENPRPEKPPDQVSPSGDAPPSEEQQELYYANLSFHGLKPRKPEDQEAKSTHVYSEIKKASK
ncbi:sialic acid-binding Ig-like lectin 5 isoform X3 [Saccopteryx bilineata]|uniref:sialic acid-binding Ig-like lectin 5 isoform X3 n=1 Tax=Saccopteryx bilineata TaxID=59482 RepID=UPI00338F9AA4